MSCCEFLPFLETKPYLLINPYRAIKIKTSGKKKKKKETKNQFVKEISDDNFGCTYIPVIQFYSKKFINLPN